MTRSILKAAEWTLGPETGEGAPEGIYSAECVTCGAQAQPTDNERLPVEVWAMKQTGLNPTHRQFKALAKTFWRVTPAQGSPYRETDAQGAWRLHDQHHARWLPLPGPCERQGQQPLDPYFAGRPFGKINRSHLVSHRSTRPSELQNPSKRDQFRTVIKLGGCAKE